LFIILKILIIATKRTASSETNILPVKGNVFCVSADPLGFLQEVGTKACYAY